MATQTSPKGSSFVAVAAAPTPPPSAASLPPPHPPCSSRGPFLVDPLPLVPSATPTVSTVSSLSGRPTGVGCLRRRCCLRSSKSANAPTPPIRFSPYSHEPESSSRNTYKVAVESGIGGNGGRYSRSGWLPPRSCFVFCCWCGIAIRIKTVGVIDQVSYANNMNTSIVCLSLGASSTTSVARYPPSNRGGVVLSHHSLLLYAYGRSCWRGCYRDKCQPGLGSLTLVPLKYPRDNGGVITPAEGLNLPTSGRTGGKKKKAKHKTNQQGLQLQRKDYRHEPDLGVV